MTAPTRKLCDQCIQHASRPHSKRFVPAVGDYELSDGRIVSLCGPCRQTGFKEKLSTSQPDFGGTYAGKVGSKGGGASYDGAERLQADVSEAQREVLHLLAKFGACGAEDFAKRAGELPYLKEPRLRDADYVSPRLSELTTKGFLRKGPKTAVTARGNPAHVYMINQTQEQAA